LAARAALAEQQTAVVFIVVLEKHGKERLMSQ